MAITATGSSANLSQVYPPPTSSWSASTDTPVGNTQLSNSVASASIHDALASVAGSDQATPMASGSTNLSDGDAIVRNAKALVGRRVGTGECTEVADRALRGAGKKSDADYGAITPDGDYQWGKEVDVNSAKPGDVLQFRDYESTTSTNHPDGSGKDWTATRPHHTAVVVSNDGQGHMTVVEQNSPVGSPVHVSHLTFGNSTTHNPDGSTTTISTTGTVKAYEPENR